MGSGVDSSDGLRVGLPTPEGSGAGNSTSSKVGSRVGKST